MLLLLLAYVPPAVSSQSSPHLPTINLCRANVSPCQSELNLPEGGDAELTISITVPEIRGPTNANSLAGWYIRLLFEEDSPADRPIIYIPSVPIQERGSPDLALDRLTPVSENGRVLDDDTGQYYRVRNRYFTESRSLEYGVALLDTPSGPRAEPSIPLRAGQDLHIGNLSLRAQSAGTTRIIADSSPQTASVIAAAGPGTRLASTLLQAKHPLAQINVGPNAEKVRLQGYIWSDLPTLENALHPFTRSFNVEFWPAGSIPPWQGGTATPVAVYSALISNSAGEYRITDLHPQALPPGKYDLRVKAPGTLSVLSENVEINTIGDPGNIPPQAIEVNLGPMPSGDTNGDNVIDEADLSALQDLFGKLTRSLETDLYADFNGDSVIDVQDFSLLAANFGRRGQ